MHPDRAKHTSWKQKQRRGTTGRLDLFNPLHLFSRWRETGLVTYRGVVFSGPQSSLQVAIMRLNPARNPPINRAERGGCVSGGAVRVYTQTPALRATRSENPAHRVRTPRH